jgi:hypothetical protein
VSKWLLASAGRFVRTEGLLWANGHFGVGLTLLGVGAVLFLSVVFAGFILQQVLRRAVGECQVALGLQLFGP